jgi:hypothetical protein
LNTILLAPVPTAWLGENPLAGAGLGPGPDPGEGELAKENQTVLVAVVLAVFLVEDMDARRLPAPWPANSTAMSAIKRPRMIHLRYGFRLSGPLAVRPHVLLPASRQESIGWPEPHRNRIWQYANGAKAADSAAFSRACPGIDLRWRFR